MKINMALTKKRNNGKDCKTYSWEQSTECLAIK